MLEIRSAFETRYDVGRHPADAEPGVTFRELVDWDLVQVAAWRGRIDELRERVESTLGVAAPREPNRCAGHDGIEVLTVAPQRLWCLGPAGDRRLAQLVGVGEDTGCVTQLGHSHARVRLGGRSVRRLLAQEAAIDLDPEPFPSGAIARTSFHHAPVMVQCIDAEAGTFDLYLTRTFAASTWEYLLDLATAYGYEILERSSAAASP